MTPKQWEYLHEPLPDDEADRMARLDQLGRGGWELCSVVRIPFSGAHFGYFKRERL